jgi:hypothetical protein
LAGRKLNPLGHLVHFPALTKGNRLVGHPPGLERNGLSFTEKPDSVFPRSVTRQF